MAVINEIQMRTPYRVVHSRTGADTELVITLKKRDKAVININQLGEIREGQLTFAFDVLWLDRRAGRHGEALSSPKRKEGELPPLGPDGKEKPPTPVVITPTAYYAVELGGTNASAEMQIYKNLATQIVNMMEKSNTGWRSRGACKPGPSFPRSAWERLFAALRRVVKRADMSNQPMNAASVSVRAAERRRAVPTQSVGTRIYVTLRLLQCLPGKYAIG